MKHSTTRPPFTCVTCEAEIPHAPTFHLGLPFCCAGCAANGPCICSYDPPFPAAGRVRHCLDVRAEMAASDEAPLPVGSSALAFDADRVAVPAAPSIEAARSIAPHSAGPGSPAEVEPRVLVPSRG